MTTAQAPADGPRRTSSTTTTPGRIDAAVVVALLVAAHLVRRLALPTDGLVFDDSWVVVGATKAGPGQLLDVSTNHPGFTAVLMAWARVVSPRSELFAWVPFVAGVLAPAAAYLVASRSLRISRLVAAAAGTLLVVAPEHAVFSGRVKPYVVGTLVTIGLAAAVPVLARRRWTWRTAVAWTAAALLVGSIEALTLVVTAVAILVLVAHPQGDRPLRIAALVAQGGLQVALLRVVQGRFASSTVAKEWELTYDGYLELDDGPISFLRQVGAHVARLGQNLVPGSKLVGVAIVALALAGLGWRSWRGSQRIAARFLLSLVGVSFVGGVVRQIPFGPSVGNPYFPGGRASLWMLPALLFGLAWAVDGLRSLLARRRPELGPALGGLALAGAVLVAGIHADDPRTYPLPGMGTTARQVRALVDDRTLVVVLPSGSMTLSAEPGVPVDLVADTGSHQGFELRWRDERWDGNAIAAFPNRFRDRLRAVDQVVVVNAVPGFGDQPLDGIEATLDRAGFRRATVDHNGGVVVDVWRRR